VDDLVRLEHPSILPVRLKHAKHFVRFQVVRFQHGTKEEWRSVEYGELLGQVSNY